MTFTEAAVEVLRLVGKPLHYKKITEIAIDHNLLSHVGKTPEITMSSRLATMVKKDRGEAPIVKVKPGVFGLREFSSEVLQAAEAESGHEYELPDKPAAGKASNDKANAKGAASGPESPSGESAEQEGASAKSSSPKLPGADVFPEEEDDDEPILAKLDRAEEDESQKGEGNRSRKRRRRKKRGGSSGPDKAKDRVSDKPKAGGQDKPKAGGQDKPKAGGQDKSGRTEARSRGGGGARPVRGDWERPAGEGEPVAQDLADAVAAVLDDGDKRPMTHARVAELLVKRGRLQGSASALAPTVSAAVLGDEARRRSEGRPPRFRNVPGGLGLTGWQMPPEARKAEQDAWRAADRQREAVYKELLRRLSNMPATAFMELIAAWLNAEGVSSLRGVRAPAKGGYHLAGTLRQGGQDTRLAVVIWPDGMPIGREHVIEVRGGLHHYGQASAAWLVTTGRAQSGGWEEAGVAGQAPCVLFDGSALAAAMERLGIGLHRVWAPMSMLDFELLDSLSPSSEAIETSSDDQANDTSESASNGDAERADSSGDGSGRKSRRRRRRGSRSNREDKETSNEDEAARADDDVKPRAEDGSSNEDSPKSESASEQQSGADARDDDETPDASGGSEGEARGGVDREAEAGSGGDDVADDTSPVEITKETDEEPRG